MTCHALSERVKMIKKSAARKSRLKEAAWAYEYEQTKEKPAGLRKIASQFEVSFTTLSDWLKRGGTAGESSEQQQKVKAAEERTLVDFIKESADNGFPLNHIAIRLYANAILKSRQGPQFEPVGHQWVYRFLDRHRDELQTHWSRPLDTQRARSLNPEAKKAWFELVQKYIVDEHIKPEDIYAMDESGFPPSHQGRDRVVGARGTKTQHKQGGANRENVTAIVTICADGTALNPMIIYKGKNFMKKWGDNNVANATISFSENGWTDGKLGREWIEIFANETKEKTGGRTRVLIVDGHSSHYTKDVLDYAMANNIVMLGYPPHCTHALQGLDVVCFAKMKNAWKRSISEFEEKTKRSVTKGDFTEVFGKAYLEAFSAETVKAAFSATGIHPFNPDVITESQMKPSTTTSTKGTFPLPQTSPVRAVMAAFRANPPTSADIDEATHLPQPQGTASNPSTPIRPKRTTDNVVDPSLYTPTKRIRLLSSALASTSSGSYLVSKAVMKSTQVPSSPVLEAPAPLPTPDWSLLGGNDPAGTTAAQLQAHNKALRESLALARGQISARELVIESNQAQLVIQDLHLRKQNQALWAKENKKENDRTILFPGGLGRALTASDFREAVEKQAAATEAKKTAKHQRAGARANKKASKAAIDARWKEVKEEHARDVEKWQKECEKLTEEGVPKTRLPQKPKCPLKQTVIDALNSGLARRRGESVDVNGGCDLDGAGSDSGEMRTDFNDQNAGVEGDEDPEAPDEEDDGEDDVEDDW